MTTLAYEDLNPDHDAVLFIAGRGGTGRGWHLYQVPAFHQAGYRTITFDNRGIGATENASNFSTEMMVADTIELIESLHLAPVRIVAVSMGSFIAQELMVLRPDLVKSAVLMATRGRDDYAREFFATAEGNLFDSGVTLPVDYEAKMRLLESFSPTTLANSAVVKDWIAMFTTWPVKSTPGLRTQLNIAPRTNRLPAYGNIQTPVLVIGFSDDVITPAVFTREVAQAIPHARYREIPDAGHLGFLEKPHLVNQIAIDFLREIDQKPPCTLT